MSKAEQFTEAQYVAAEELAAGATRQAAAAKAGIGLSSLYRLLTNPEYVRLIEQLRADEQERQVVLRVREELRELRESIAFLLDPAVSPEDKLPVAKRVLGLLEEGSDAS